MTHRNCSTRSAAATDSIRGMGSRQSENSIDVSGAARPFEILLVVLLFLPLMPVQYGTPWRNQQL